MKNNKYIKILMNRKNEFVTTADFCFMGMECIDVDVKIDTGCGHSSFPVSRFGFSKIKAYDMKSKDSNNPDIKKHISFGVNDSVLKRKEDKHKFKKGLYMDLSSITFSHKLEDMSIAGYSINCTDVRISYDRTGNVLIGMDILKNFDIHIGTTVSGDTVLLACLKDNITKEYSDELEKLFDIRKVV